MVYMVCLKTGQFIVKLTLGVIFILSAVVAPAQRLDLNPNSFNNRLQNQNGTGVYSAPQAGVQDNSEPTQADTVKKAPRIRKPLESYFFGDSTRARQNFVWNLDLGYNDVRLSQVDTSVNGFQNDYPYLKNDVGSVYLGNMGGASTPLNFFLRPQYRNFQFSQAFDQYMTSPEKARFFNVKKPFTQADYFFGGQTKRMEEQLHIVHAQNISPSTGFNIEYSSVGTRGIYQNQKSRDKALSVAFSHTGKKYSIHAGYIFNSINLRENGGITDDRNITDTVFELPETVPVKLTVANNVLKNNTFYLMQSYGIPLRRLTDNDFSIADRPSLFIGHSFEYSRFYKKYTDTRAGTQYQGPQADGSLADMNFYDNWFIDQNASNDSIFESLLSNKVFVQIQPWDRNSVVGVINAGIGNDMHHYYYFTPNQYLNKSKGENRNSTYVYGSIRGSVNKYFNWHAKAQYHPFGYRSQDMSLSGGIELSAFIKDRPITLKGDLVHQRNTPGYWTENYFSNHFVWNNSFAKESETRLNATLSIPAIDMELGGWHSINTDKIYFGADMLPKQKAGSVNVSGLYARKDFRIGGLHLNNRVLLQFSSDQEVVPVPLASIYLSYYYEFQVVKNVLRLQLGIDGRYNTEYYAFGYNPSTAQFYNQREKKLGAYPLMDVFVAAKWKRMRILVKLQHLNDNLFGERNYFSVLHHPLNKRVLKLGLSWAFYD